MIQLMEEILHHFIGRSSHPIFTRSYASQVVVWVFWTINNTITISEMLENCTIKMITFGTLPRWMSFLGQRSFIPRSIRSSKKNIPKSVDSVKIIQHPSISRSKSQVAIGCLIKKFITSYIDRSIWFSSHACAVVAPSMGPTSIHGGKPPQLSPGGGCKHLAENMGWNDVKWTTSGSFFKCYGRLYQLQLYIN